MAKLFGFIMLLIALYIGMTIYTEGIESVYHRVVSSTTPANDRDTPMSTHPTAGDQGADTPNTTHSRRGPLTERVRERVTADIEEGARRQGY